MSSGRHPQLERLLSSESGRRVAPLGRAERDGLLGHIRDCTDCRDDLARHDPARLFSLLAVDEIPTEALDRLSLRVSAAVDACEPPARTVRARAAAWVTLAASLILAALFAGVSTPPQRPAATVAAVEPAVPGEAAAPDVPFSAALADRGRLPGNEIHVVETPGSSQVVDMSIGGTQVVMVFDEALEI